MEVIIQQKKCRNNKYRYVVTDLDGKVIDTAQGYGYKSPEKAIASVEFKTKTKVNIQEIIMSTDFIQPMKYYFMWCPSCKTYYQVLNNKSYHCNKCDNDITKIYEYNSEDMLDLVKTCENVVRLTQEEIWEELYDSDKME